MGHVASVELKISYPAEHGVPITFANPMATVSQTAPTAFEIPQGGGASNCPAQLLPQHKCKLTVLFSPTSPGQTFSTVTILDNAANANQTIQLKGRGK